MAASLLAALLVACTAWCGDPVHFDDPVLKGLVEDRLGVFDPTPEDMRELRTVLDYWEQAGITDLTGLEYASNLEYLDVYENAISDLSPLAGLTQLQYLDVAQNQVTDLAPLAGLTRLEFLNIHGNPTGDLTALAGLLNLKTLYARQMQISDLSPLSGLCSLEYLELFKNRITSLSPLANLGHLSFLSFGLNQVSDLEPLRGLTNLTELRAPQNRITDLGALCSPDMGHLTYLNLLGNYLSDEACQGQIPVILAHNPGLYVEGPCSATGGPKVVLDIASGPGGFTQPGEGAYAYDPGQVVLLKAEPYSMYRFSHWSGSLDRHDNPCSLTLDQDAQVRANFVSVLSEILVDAGGPNDPGPGDSRVSDPQEDGTPGHPFDSIQEAIDVAGHGASVVVRPGIYRETIDLRARQIRVTGLDPADPCSPYPVIDGNGIGPVVRLECGEDPNCILEGLVITGGRSERAAAIHCLDSSPTFVRCLIVGNVATGSQGAVVLCRDSGATFSHCTIADNTPGLQGSVFSLAESPVTLANSIVWGNGSRAFLVYGAKGPAVAYTCVAGGWPGQGNLDTDPLFSTGGSWAPGLDGSGPVWIPGDYHLRSGAGRWDPVIRQWVPDAVTGPCIDAGDPDDPVGPEPAPHGDRVNLGAYGGTAQASRSIVRPVQ